MSRPPLNPPSLSRQSKGQYYEQQARRLETAKVELAAESEFDVTIVNETVDQAAADLWSVIAKEYGL